MAETTSTVSISTTGTRTGKPYQGKITVKTVLNRRENFLADERRRFILGGNAASAPPALQGEAFMLGLLYVRIVDGPDWWKNSDGGLELEDENVIGELYKLTEDAIAEREKELQSQSEKALKTLAKSVKKVDTRDQEAE
jgi:hypothetical protein